jgi:ribosomal protein S13
MDFVIAIGGVKHGSYCRRGSAREKKMKLGLPIFFGVGRTRSNQILEKTGINPDTRIRDLTDDEISS